MKATQVLELDIEDAKQKQFQEGLVKDGKCRAHIRTLQRFLWVKEQKEDTTTAETLVATKVEFGVTQLILEKDGKNVDLLLMELNYRRQQCNAKPSQELQTG